VHELEEARHVVRDLREELSRAETQAQGLRTMLESMRSGVLATDAAGRIVLGNEAAATLLGLSADRLTDAVLTDFLGLDENQLGAMWQELRISGSLDNLEIELHAKDMARSPMLVWGSRLPEPTAEGGVYVFVFHDISERKSLEEKLIHKTLHDELTGLPNKVHLLRRLSEELGQLAEEPGGSLALVFIDLDRFKHVNEVFGHGVGDQLLTYIARRLSSLVRSGDMIARVGSDEFVILLGNLRRSETALEIGRRAQATIARPVDVEGRELLVRGVVGIVQTDDAEADPARLLTDADIAMYRAKAAGGDRLAVFTEEMRADFERLTAVESSLREAVLVKRFEVRYQPIVDIQSRRCAGLEAFVRWRHPERGLLPPAEFITLACETGLIMPLGRIMREQAFADFRELKRSHPVIEFLSVNIAAPELFRREGFVEDFMAAVGLGGLSPSEVAVEVTETSILENPAESGRLLRELKEYGIRLVLDDFGVGVSSLSHLSDFPFDMVKIDRGAVAAMLHDEAAMAMVRSVCDLGRTMQVDILAEGVETEEQRRTLAGLGCPRFQGYLQSAPATIGEIDEMLDAAPDAGANS
jgi:diguanylate cyclase (GGDEF)-like protein/PAS domain S-box-containing protein